MSGKVTARDVIARAIATRLDGYEVTPWSLTDAVLAALAAAGWELHRAGEVVPTSDVINLARRWDHTAAGNQLRALTQQEPR